MNFNTRTINLTGPQQRATVATLAQNVPDGIQVVFREPVKARKLSQNALLHAVLSEIADQVDWNGKRLSIEIWKRLCVASWLREEKEFPVLIPSLDGNGFDVIYEKTSKLSVAQCASLIEWCFAFGVEHNVKFSTGKLDASSAR